MIRAITIKNLRGIREGALEGFTPLTVLVGPNSAGKSTVLDALMIGASPVQHIGLQFVMERRPILGEPDAWLLYRSRGRNAEHAVVEIKTDARNRPTRIHPLSPGDSRMWAQGLRETDQPALPDVPEIHLVDPHDWSAKRSLADLYTQVAERGVRNEATAILKGLLPDVQGIEVLSRQNKPVVYLVYAGGAQPIELAGDGVRLLLQQTLELAAPPGGVVLLEEPEVHMHPGAIRQSARAMFAAMRRGIQIILTTHSLDVIDALLAEIHPDELEMFSLFRLQLDDGHLKSYRLSGEEASLARTQIEDDLR